MKVLIADDEDASRLLLEKMLRTWGYLPVMARDGNEAWVMLSQPSVPRLVILDWMMPGVDGPELCRRIRSSRASLYSYVILLTSRSEKEDVILGIDSGADAFLIKPVDFNELRSRLAAGKRIIQHQEALSSRLEMLETKVGPRQSASDDERTLKIPQQLQRRSQNLLSDRFLEKAPRIRANGRNYPALGEIPLLCKLGEGGMGAVYLGFNPRLQREIAVKVMAPERFRNNAEMVERFYREAQIATLIKSPYLVTVHDIDEDNGVIYITMEFVDGQSASNCMRDAFRHQRQGLDEGEALELCVAVAKGLAAAHASGIIHRDIKPDNILIPYDESGQRYSFGRAKLADLGVARQEMLDSGLTATNAVLGTIGFMAPEQIRDAKHVGKPADVFALGATLYSLLAGRIPFNGESNFVILERTISRPHTPLREIIAKVSPATESIVDICLSKDPSQRYPDAQALVGALEGALAAFNALNHHVDNICKNSVYVDCCGQPVEKPTRIIR